MSVNNQMDLNQDKYALFLEWFLANGGKYQKDLIQYPSYYHPGNYIGVGAKAVIPRNKVVVAIPFKLIITIKRVQEELRELYDDVYKQEDDEEEDLEFLILTLYITYHRQKGSESFFYHYLNLVPSPENLFDWNSNEVAECEDPYLTGLFHEEQEQIPLLFDIYRKYVLKYSNIFSAPVTMKEFLWSLNFVQTRCYGWGFPETLLSPFADLFNHHSQETIGHYMFKTEYEGRGSNHPKQYIVKAQCLNIELLGIQSREAKKYQPNERVLTLKSYYPEIEEEELVEREAHYWQQYLNSTLLKNPLGTELLQSDDSQDNDSEEQSQDQQTFDSKIQALKSKQNPPEKYTTLCLKDYNSPSLPINQEFQEESDFSWYNHRDPSTYFIISTGKRAQKGEQLFNSYGQRGNRFLLMWYGFALQKNKYNSIPFRLSLAKGNSIGVYEKYVSLEEMEKGIKIKGKKVEVSEYLTGEFRLKERGLCEKLIMYIRFRLLKRTGDKSRRVTFPDSLKNQLQMFKIYEEIIQYLRKAYSTTTLQEDLQLLNQPGLKERHIFALIHRIGNKRLIEIQWSLVKIVQKIIYDLIDNKGFEEAVNAPRQEERDELLGNTDGRVFYTQRLLKYLRPLTYLTQ